MVPPLPCPRRRPATHGPRLLLVALALATAAVACGSDHPRSGATATTIAPPNTVIIEDRTFAPRELTVRVGDVVTWINQDIVEHEVVGLDPNVLDSGKLGQAQSYSKTFSKAGRYPYYCSIHNEMKGTVVVQ